MAYTLFCDLVLFWCLWWISIHLSWMPVEAPDIYACVTQMQESGGGHNTLWGSPGPMRYENQWIILFPFCFLGGQSWDAVQMFPRRPKGIHCQYPTEVANMIHILDWLSILPYIILSGSSLLFPGITSQISNQNINLCPRPCFGGIQAKIAFRHIYLKLSKPDLVVSSPVQLFFLYSIPLNQS